MSAENDFSELVALRALVASEAAAGPVEPEPLVAARLQVSDLRDRSAATDDPVEQYKIEREMARIYRSTALVSCEFEQRRREHQRATDEARRHLQRSVRAAYAERRARALERIEAALNAATRELESLEQARSLLEEQFAPTGVSEFANSRLLQMLRDARRYMHPLAEGAASSAISDPR